MTFLIEFFVCEKRKMRGKTKIAGNHQRPKRPRSRSTNNFQMQSWDFKVQCLWMMNHQGDNMFAFILTLEMF